MHDFTYMTFWKRLNYRARKHITASPELCLGDGLTKKGTSEEFSMVMELLYFDCDGRYTTVSISQNSRDSTPKRANVITHKLKIGIKSVMNYTININNKRTKKQDQHVCVSKSCI